MPDSDDLERRLAAVERAIDGGDRTAHAESDGPPVEERLATLEARVDELDAAVQSVRGFLGGVSAVNEAVERRADAAVAAVERLERRLDGEAPDETLDEPDTDRRDGPDDDIPDRSSDGASIEIPGDGAGENGLRDRLRDRR